MEEARKKIEDEMAKNKANVPLLTIGRMLLRQLESNPGAAPAIMAKDKTLAGSLSAMRDEAKAHHTHGGIAVLSDDEGFNMVLNYFGITAGQTESAPVKVTATRKRAFDIDLDDLLSEV